METIRVLRGTDRRRATAFFVVHERRSGFDRRARRPSRIGAELERSLVYLRDHPSSLAILLLVGNLLSFLDLALTRVSLDLGATEANPLLRPLISTHPDAAMLLKIWIVAALSLLIWRFRCRRRIVGLAIYLVVFYSTLIAYELASITQSL